MQFRGTRIIQSPCRTNTNRPVKTTLNTMQPANAIIAGLKSDAAMALCVACRALWIKNAIIAKYGTIIASTSQKRRAPDLFAVTRDGTYSMASCTVVPLALLRRISCDQ